MTSFLYKTELCWWISCKKWSNQAEKLPKVNNYAPDIIAFFTVFLACLGFWTRITGPIQLKIGHENLIFNWNSMTINLSLVWILIIDCYAWYSVIALSEPKESIWRLSCEAIFMINHLCNSNIESVVLVPLFRSNAITIGGNAGNSI